MPRFQPFLAEGQRFRFIAVGPFGLGHLKCSDDFLGNDWVKTELEFKVYTYTL